MQTKTKPKDDVRSVQKVYRRLDTRSLRKSKSVLVFLCTAAIDIVSQVVLEPRHNDLPRLSWICYESWRSLAQTSKPAPEYCIPPRY